MLGWIGITAMVLMLVGWAGSRHGRGTRTGGDGSTFAAGTGHDSCSDAGGGCDGGGDGGGGGD